MCIPESYSNEALELLEELLEIPAFSGEESTKADVLERKLQSWGYAPERNGNNLWMTGEWIPNAPVIWLHSHIDTVRPAQGWTVPPFGGKFSNGKLVALGSNDAGASVVAQLAAFRYLKEQSQLAVNLVWIAGAEEENSGPGGVISLLDLLPPADLVLVGEPTSNKAAVAEKGLLVIDVEVHGKSGHAAREEGINALYLALDDLIWLRDFQFDKVSEFLGPVRMNATVCASGKQHNTVPDLCTYTVDIRLNDRYSHEEILEIISAHVRGTIQARSTRLKPSATPKEHPVWQAIHALDLMPYGSPTLSDQALIPYPSLKIGPGDSARSHTANEFIHTQEIKEGIQVYVELLLKTYENE
ncbi:MAG: M20/M25/M40 family metallo-hydrolase [Bacteroidia bacterium]